MALLPAGWATHKKCRQGSCSAPHHFRCTTRMQRLNSSVTCGVNLLWRRMRWERHICNDLLSLHYKIPYFMFQILKYAALQIDNSNQLNMIQGCSQDFELFGLKTDWIFKKTGKVSSCSAYNFTSIMEMSCGN